CKLTVTRNLGSRRRMKSVANHMFVRSNLWLSGFGSRHNILHSFALRSSCAYLNASYSVNVSYLCFQRGETFFRPETALWATPWAVSYRVMHSSSRSRTTEKETTLP